jgi:hypothetical protein
MGESSTSKTDAVCATGKRPCLLLGIDVVIASTAEPSTDEPHPMAWVERIDVRVPRIELTACHQCIH